MTAHARKAKHVSNGALQAPPARAWLELSPARRRAHGERPTRRGSAEAGVPAGPLWGGHTSLSRALALPSGPCPHTPVPGTPQVPGGRPAMGDPQETLAAYHEVLGVLSCRTPASTINAVAYALRTSRAVRGLPPEQVAGVETMTYGSGAGWPR